jgi:hypothetical protein
VRDEGKAEGYRKAMAKKPLRTSTSASSLKELFTAASATYLKYESERTLRKSRPWAYDICRCLWRTRSQLSVVSHFEL